MTIDEYINECTEKLSIGLQDMNGEELFIGDEVIFYKRKFVQFDSKEEAEMQGFNTDGHYSKWYATDKVRKMKAKVSFDMDMGWYFAGTSRSKYQYREEAGRLVNIEKVRGDSE